MQRTKSAQCNIQIRGTFNIKIGGRGGNNQYAFKILSISAIIYFDQLNLIFKNEPENNLDSIPKHNFEIIVNDCK